MFRWLRHWFGKSKQRQAILYTRHGCHLCDVAAQTLEQAGYAVQMVDIDENSELRQKFDHEVPVVEIDGRIRFRGRVDPLLLKRLS
jgi:glutaredoxin